MLISPSIDCRESFNHDDIYHPIAVDGKSVDGKGGQSQHIDCCHSFQFPSMCSQRETVINTLIFASQQGESVPLLLGNLLKMEWLGIKHPAFSMTAEEGVSMYVSRGTSTAIWAGGRWC